MLQRRFTLPSLHDSSIKHLNLVSLEPGAGQRIIIDTKYYRETLQEHHEKKSIQSKDLFQIFSYLKNSEARGSEYSNAEGILLYPAVGEKLLFRANIQGHPLQVVTINLDQPWQNIRADLLGILQD